MVADYYYNKEKFPFWGPGASEREMARTLPNGCYYYVDEIEGFVEEIIENEVFWVLGNDGTIYKAENGNYFAVPKWMRFRTKESAEKFANALKDLHGRVMVHECVDGNAAYSWMDEKDYKFDGDVIVRSIVNALNDRVK